MPDDLAAGVDLNRGERLLGSWRVELAEGDRASGRSGLLVLTSERCLLYQKAGFLGGRLEKPPLLAWRLEELRSVVPQRFWMKIGYGDQVEIPGLGIDGYGFRLNRDTPSDPVVEAIRRARDGRRAALHLPLR